jgi:carbamoyltransferase
VKVLGISGIDGTAAFKRNHFPGLEDREYRIVQGHDSAAALIVDGEPISAVAQERISRRKHTGEFPAGAVQSCVAQAGLDPADLDEIVHAFDYGPYRALYGLDPISAQLYDEVLSPQAFAAHVRRALPAADRARIACVDHHLAHAASAYYTSGWSDCMVVVIDGMGEAHGATVYSARDGQLRPLRRIPAADSIGILYSVVTLHLGFDFNADEYKVMGLAPYGDPDRHRDFFAHTVPLRDDGGWEIPLLRQGRTREDRENHTAARRHLAEHLIAPRAVEGPLGRDHEDVAAALQDCLDRAMLHLCRHYGSRLNTNRLALAGGVALNTTANARLLAAGLFDEIYVQPAAADDGSALGAAMQRAGSAGEAVNRRSPTPFYGPAASDPEVEEALRQFAGQIEVVPLNSLQSAAAAAAQRIAAGEVIAWYHGRMEFGPRALGHRSILADPGVADMRDRVNALVKMREAFRPFAPAVTAEQVHRWFEVAPGTELPYMNVNADVRREWRSELPAVTHVDGSARVQTVSTRDNATFHSLLRELGRLKGREVVLNTSFNVRGQPIVNTPAEAIETFLGTGLQALFLEGRMVRKR